jgi:vitamin B12 transporter
MRFFTLLFILAAAAAFASAQGRSTLVGTLSDSSGNVAGATVTFSSVGRAEKLTTTTDLGGRFSAELVPAVTYSVLVTVSRNGAVQTFTPNIGTFTLSSGETREVNIDIPLNAGIRETVTVSAGEDQPIEQVSKTVDVVSGQEMRDRADFTLIDSLRTIPGLRVQQSGGFGRVASIKTRGLRNQDTAVLIDGVRFRDASAISGDATSLLSDLTLTSVSRVEVLRGPGSSLYGTNAIGGTIDFRTPSARSGTHGQIGGAAGGLGLGRFRGNLSHGTENGKVGIGGGVSRTVYTKGIDGDDRAANTNLQTRIDAKPFEKTAIFGTIFFTDANVRLNTDPDTLGVLPPTNATIIDAVQGVNFRFDANDPDRRQKSRSFAGRVAMTQIVNDKLVFDVGYNGNSTERQNDNGPLGAGFQSASTSTFEGRIGTANAKLTWRPSRLNTLTAGYEYERENFLNEGRTPTGTGNFFTRTKQSSNAFFAQNLSSLMNGKLQLAGGLRIQRFGLGRPAFSLQNAPYNPLTLDSPPSAVTFDGAASYFVERTSTKFRTHIGTGYRIPSLYERFGTFFSTFGGPQFVAIGDPFLKPEKSIAFDVGIEQGIAADRVKLTATYFYTRLRDVIGYANVVPNIGSTGRPFGGYLNQKGGISRGGEFSVRAAATRTTEIFTSYTYTNSDQRAPQVAGSGVIRTLGVPDHQFTMVINQRIGRAWFNFDFVGTSSYLAPIYSNSVFRTYIYRFNGSRRGDLTGGYTFAIKKESLSMRVFGTIENIFDHEYYENGFRTAGVNARAGISFSF